MIRTHTRTHVYVTFANPFLVCLRCRQPVHWWHNQDRCGCDDTWWNMPCGHERAGITSVCPSWGPVDGCTCMEGFGFVPHGPAPDWDGQP